MGGSFQTSRDIFANPIWKNIVEFRLFFLIYGNAVYSEEGYRVSADLHLERGQWLRSTRKLQEDLTYIENRQVKTYSTSSLHRAILSLVKAQRICTKTHDLGTVFTVLNYEQYQGFGGIKVDNLERNLEQSENSVGTVLEQQQNNNKKENKEKNEKKDINNKPTLYKNGRDDPTKTNYSDDVWLRPEQYEKLVSDHGEDGTKEMIEILNSYKVAKQEIYASDYHTMSGGGWVLKRYREENKLTVITGGVRNAKPRGSSERRDNEYDRLSL